MSLLDPDVAAYVLVMGLFILGAWLMLRVSGSLRHLVDKRLGDPRCETQLEGLRGILALGVLFHHSVITRHFLQTGVWERPASNFFAHLGSSSVLLFFFVTGYLFWGQLLNRPEGLRSLGRFYLARFLRLVPVYWLLCVAVFLCALAQSRFTLRAPGSAVAAQFAQWLAFGIPSNLFPDINGFPQTILVCAGVVWTLRLEVLFYALLPALKWFAVGHRTLLFLALSAAGYVLGQHCPPNLLANFTKFLFLGFGGGILTAYLKHRTRLWAHVENLAKRAGLPLIAAVLLSLVMNVTDDYGLLHAAHVLVIFLILVTGNVGAGFLKSRPMVLLGSISYSVYLFHGFFLFLARPHGLGRTEFWAVISLVGFAAIFASTLSYRFIELPAVAWGKRRHAHKLAIRSADAAGAATRSPPAAML